MTRTALAEDFRHIDPRSAHILLFEAAPRTLLTDSVGRLHIYFLIGFANRLLVTLQWGVSFVTKRRGVRILPLAQAK